MLLALALATFVILLCLAVQVGTMWAAVRYFAAIRNQPRSYSVIREHFTVLSKLMLLLMAGVIVQIAIWATLYHIFGDFPDFETALYFSGVTFTSLGYGDVVLARDIRLFAPVQAASGLLMFGITTAVLVAAVQNGIVRLQARLKSQDPD